ncbi:MAG: hypothetical protein F6K30_16805 [Cyanothece sp. SIO2G6]|nr:hypothetical protein [Cyanothece sp. SIO2G6]
MDQQAHGPAMPYGGAIALRKTEHLIGHTGLVAIFGLTTPPIINTY